MKSILLVIIVGLVIFSAYQTIQNGTEGTEMLFLPAYAAETIPQSLHGYETSGGKYSQVWLEWNDLKLVNATITLPDKEWNAIIIPLEITKYSNSDDGTMSMFSQINKFTQIMFTGKYIDEGVMQIDARLSMDGMIIPFQYIANVTTTEYEPILDLEVRTSPLNLIEIGTVNSISVTTHDMEDYKKKYEGLEMTMEITRGDKTIFTKTGKSDKFGRWIPEFVVTWPEYHPAFCYDVLITAQHKDQTFTVSEDFMVFIIGNFEKAVLETPDLFDQPSLNSDSKCNS